MPCAKINEKDVLYLKDRLYIRDGNTFEFETAVKEVRQSDRGYEVLLFESAFFPGGGGQECDKGSLNDFPVFDVFERDSEVWHITKEAFKSGDRVFGKIDKELRIRRMQNHSGEHIISGLANKLFGADNIGFHLSDPYMTIDLSVELGEEEIEFLELMANKAIYENLEICSYFPENLYEIDYRSKKETGELTRLISIEGVDCCACCAPHLKRTGQIGLIKITDFMRHRGGTRLTALCGLNALSEYRALDSELKAASRLLSAPKELVSKHLEQRLEEIGALKQKIKTLCREYIDLKLEEAEYILGNRTEFFEDYDFELLRYWANTAKKLCGGVAAAFSKNGDFHYYVIGSENLDMRKLSKEINANINGRGGGSAAMIEGKAEASREHITDYFMSTYF